GVALPGEQVAADLPDRAGVQQPLSEPARHRGECDGDRLWPDGADRDDCGGDLVEAGDHGGHLRMATQRVDHPSVVDEERGWDRVELTPGECDRTASELGCGVPTVGFEPSGELDHLDVGKVLDSVHHRVQCAAPADTEG